MMIGKSYEPVYKSPGKSLPVLGTMGLSHEEFQKLWEALDHAGKEKDATKNDQGKLSTKSLFRNNPLSKFR